MVDCGPGNRMIQPSIRRGIPDGSAADSHPRQYPSLVTLIRRVDNGASVAPAKVRCEELRDFTHA